MGFGLQDILESNFVLWCIEASAEEAATYILSAMENVTLLGDLQ